MNWPDRDRAGRIARVELRRTWRSLRASNRGILLVLGGLVMVPLYSLAIGAMAYLGGGEIRTAAPGDVRLATTGIVVGLLGLTGFVVLQRTVKRTGEPDAADGLLTTVRYEDALAGLLAAEFGRLLAVAALPLTALTVGVTVGSGLPLLGLAVMATSVLVVLFGLLASYAVGLSLKLVVARSAFVARHRAVLGGLASLGIVLAWLVAWGTDSVQLALLRAATNSPLSWLGELVLLAVPSVGAAPLAAAVAAAVVLGGLPVAGLACLWLAERVWYGDAVQPDHEFDADGRSLSDRLLAGRVSTATRVVAGKSWRRARRAPLTVQFAVAPAFLLVVQLQTLLLERTVPPTLPLTAGLATAAAAGAAFTLNPLGGEERVLPLTLTADVSGRQFVTGLALAGLLPGVGLATLFVVGFGLAAGTPPATLAAAVTTALVATLAAPWVAAAAGVIFPKFEASTVRGKSVTVPSGFAFGFYLAVLGTVAAPGAGAVAVSTLAPSLVPVGTAALLVGGVTATLLLAAVAAPMGYLYAANRVGTYRLE
ncbi:hypothetical protein [Haloarcula onubensis]|uniref:ABC-2 type transport system permease protein n=1 Tax=Haloarcula onubensis TaxID=2950539 RepID=A0ABU2FJG1_9EURY|nr:hypothetical protein [Halomicroarcula sp. S3CR25-11]MDS0280872.1 hypothetical protein [Halomicroarcula sp. S3CR25-11]